MDNEKNQGYNPHGQDQELPRMYKKSGGVKVTCVSCFGQYPGKFSENKKVPTGGKT